MEAFDLAWAADVLSAQQIGRGANGIVVERIVTDTRQDLRGGLFFALLGENADGHRWVGQAFEKGAVGAVVSADIPNAQPDWPLLRVPDTLLALGTLAQHYRRKFDIPVIGVTGSVGKTSTKEMLASVLGTRYNVLANEANFNNEIGVPQTLFRLERSHTAAIVEMGMRGLGQIDRLAEIAEPTLGLITNIGLAHAELLGSQAAIADAKSELYARLRPGGIALLPFDSPFYETLLAHVPEGVTPFSFGFDAGRDWPPDVRVRPLPPRAGAGAEATVFFHRKEAFLGMKPVGTHVLQNAAAALSVAFALDIPLRDAVRALADWEGAPGRMVIRHTLEGATVLDDCYNAGPESMNAALDTLRLTTVLPPVAVLGDMRELGAFTEAAHQEVGRKVAETGVRLLVTVGELARELGEEALRYAAECHRPAPQTIAFPDSLACAAQIGTLIEPKDTVLVKGSRAMEMERIVAALTGTAGTHGHG